MRIDLITFSCALNYGAMLQTYGLSKFLADQGHDVQIIDYISERYDLDRDDYGEIALEHAGKWNSNILLRTIWKKTMLRGMYRNRDVFRSFLMNHVKFTKKYTSEEELRDDIPDADLYITGSDQVWNPDFVWNGCLDKPYYYSFLPDGKRRISYSSSFGKNDLSFDERKETKKYLKKYDALSVREKSGVEILNAIGLSATEVADPTILAGRKVFDQIIPSERIIPEDYILFFSININIELLRLAKALAKDKDKKLVVLIPDVNKKSKAMFYHKCVLPKVEDWIRIIADADFVITDSFHATVFSIMYHTQFISDGTVGYSGRIVSILSKMKLENRILQKLDKYEIKKTYENKIDYTLVENEFLAYQNESAKWLLDAIG